MSDINRIKNFPAKMRTVLAYLDEPVFITDPRGVVVYLNPRAEQDFGFELKLAAGRSLNEILPAGIASGLFQGLERLKKAAKSLHLSAEEESRRYQAHFNPIMQGQKLTGVVISLRPESDHQAIARLNQSLFNNLLDEIYKPINQLTMLFSREFEERNSGEPIYEKSQELVKQTIAALNNLIDVSPVLVGEIRLARSQFQPSLLLKLARRSFHSRAEAKKIHLLRLEHKDLPEVIGDQAKLNRILVIFLDHMMDLAVPGEIVALGAELSLGQNPVLSYSVTTTGVAKNEKDFYCLTGELSEEYSMACAEDKLKERNLVIASRLLLAMKGQAQIAAVENVGTTISFSVPVIIAEQKSEEAEI